jgi:hypothetical protein
MSEQSLPVHPEIQSLYETCESEGVPFLDALMIALGVPEINLSSDLLSPLRFLNSILIEDGKMSPPEAATLIITSFDGLLGQKSEEDMVES